MEDRSPRSAAEAKASSETADGPRPARGPPAQNLMPMIFGFRTTQALYVVAKLGVADLLTDGPKTADELARPLGVQPRPLFRVMRALAAMGVFTQDAADRFGLTPLGQRLRDDDPKSLRHLAIFAGEDQYRAMGELLHTVRTGETAFHHLHGMGHFDYLAEHPEASATFNAAMADGMAQWQDPDGLYDLPGRRLVVDVGGGRGHLLATVLRANPPLRGILYDLPAGVREAAAYLASQGVAGRCEIRVGSAFESVPSGGDVYILSRVLHDWPDDRAWILLANTRKAVADGGILLLRESVVPPGDVPSSAKQTDLTMMAMLGGAERTEAEWRAILAATGFELVKVTRTGGTFDLIEAKPV